MKTTMMFIATALVLVSAPIAAADETNQDCEAGQDWIGYRSTDSVSDTYEALGSPGGLFVCEGEHWDGQDSVSDRPAGTSDCATSVINDADGVALCMNANPNEGDANTVEDGASPVGARVSKSGNEVYVAANIFSVGRAVVYTDGSSTAAVYLRDNTPGNVLATAVSAPGITKGFPSENDCDQETYNRGANDPNPDTARTHCGRDNTAITVSWVLP